MREIKFRAWDKQFSKMIDILLPKKYHTEWERYELMQYTGLKDKNGVEIYEGDIVKKITPYEAATFDIEDGLEDYEITTIYVLERGTDNRMVDYICINKPGPWLYGLEGEPNTEIIGNIYENPELLEDKE